MLIKIACGLHGQQQVFLTGVDIDSRELKLDYTSACRRNSEVNAVAK